MTSYSKNSSQVPELATQALGMISDRGLGETSHVLFRDRRCEFPIGPPLSLFATLSGSGSVAEVPVLSTPVNFCTGIQALFNQQV